MNIVEKLKAYAKTYREPPTGREVEGTVELLEEAAEHIEMLGGKEERDIAFRRCICDYGTQPQVDMMIEEMSELTKALLKWRRAKGAELTATRDCIIDELADVRIMARQMEILFQAENDYSKRVDELKEAAEPLVDYLYKYGTPHDVIIVRMDSVEHLSGEAGSPIEVRD